MLEDELENIYPMIVPSSYYTPGVWELPHFSFPNSKYALTWVFFKSERSMSYIKREEFDHLNANTADWQQISFENLRNSLDEEEGFYQRFREDKVLNRLSFLIFSNYDGIGSSRILFSNELEKAFPEGYKIAIPDRSCGIVISNTISDEEEVVLKTVIDEYYGCTGTAMSKLIIPPEDFSLPRNWIEPVDEEMSNWMIEEITSYNR